jgi:hypothetical protein
MIVEVWSRCHLGYRKYQIFSFVLYPGCSFHHSYCIHFFTKAFSDGKLLQVAYAFEKVTAVSDKGPLPFKYPTTELRDVQQKAQEIWRQYGGTPAVELANLKIMSIGTYLNISQL